MIQINKNVIKPLKDIDSPKPEATSVLIGGQHGFLPQLGSTVEGASYEDYLHEAGYVRQDVIPYVLTTPKFMEFMPNPGMLARTVKAMMEVHAITIEGIDTSITAETFTGNLGYANADFTEHARTVMAKSSIKIKLKERLGNPWEKLFHMWITYGKGDVVTNVPLVNRILTPEQAVKFQRTAWSTFSTLFVEPDVLMRKPVHVFLAMNLCPTTVNVVGSKDKTRSLEAEYIEQELGGFIIDGNSNRRVMELGRLYLENSKLYELDPENLVLPETEIASGLSDTLDGNTSYTGQK